MKHFLRIGSLLVLFILSSCWDQRLLKEHSLILAVGYDVDDEQMIHKTVAFPQEEPVDPYQSTTDSESEVITTTGRTIQEADQKLEHILPFKFDRSKARVLLLGKDLASHGIYSFLDSLYRDPRGPLDAIVAVVDGEARDALFGRKYYSLEVSEFYYHLLKNTEETGIIISEDIQSIVPTLLSEGEDLVLPRIRLLDEEKMIKLEGIALFSGDQMTGKLLDREAMMLLILMNEKANRVELNMKVTDDSPADPEDYVHFAIRVAKRKFKILPENNSLEVKLDFDLRIEILEFPADHLGDEERVIALSKVIEKKLQDLAQETIRKLQEARNDSLGIGRRVHAFHHSFWDENNDWKEEYANLPIDTSFTVEVVRHGIIN